MLHTKNKGVRIMSKKKCLLSILVMLLIVVISLITYKVQNNQSLIIDNIAYNILVENLRNPTLTIFMKLVTSLINASVVIFISIILLIVIKPQKIAVTVPINLSIITILNQLLKLIFKRPRPSGYRLLEIGGYSFPSGHAMVSMAFYGFLAYLSYCYIENKYLKYLFMILNIFIIISIGISRIYLGVHYCSDIVVGYSVSLIYLILYVKILKKVNVLN